MVFQLKCECEPKLVFELSTVFSYLTGKVGSDLIFGFCGLFEEFLVPKIEVSMESMQAHNEVFLP